MTTTQTVLWVALPNGFAGEGPDRRLRLSAFVAPRLRTDDGTTLSLFPDFLDWAARLGPDAATFTVEVDDGTAVPATVVSEPADPLLWSSLFGPATPVRPFAFDDYADRPIVSYPVRGVLDLVKRVYRETAIASPTELPAITYRDGDDDHLPTLDRLFRDLLGDLREVLRVGNEAELSDRLEASLQAARRQARARQEAGERGGPHIEPPIPVPSGGAADAFYRSMLFHYRPARDEPVDLPRDQEAEARFTAEVDFHQMLTALGDYPALMRRLGLAFDLELPDGSLPVSDNELAARRVRIAATWSSGFDPLPADPGTLAVSPWTVYALAALNGRDLFMPWPTRDAGAGLWLPVAGGVDLVQVDPDGTALKTLHHVTSIDRATDGRPRAIDAPERDGLSALRTSGIALVQSGRAAAMSEDFNRSQTLNDLLDQNPSAPEDLRGEDLQRGYRLDVQDVGTGEWHSLHRRVGTFDALDYPPGPFELQDEGFTQPGATTAAEAPGAPLDPTAELYVHETLFTWDGWSLSAPRPGRALSRSARAPSPDDPETQPTYADSPAVTSMRLQVGFRPQEGTLPRLRYGRSYRVRVRAVDLAGNSPTVAEATELLDDLRPVLDPVLPEDGRDLVYRRFEPVNPPEVTSRAVFGEGESADRLVIRADYDRSAEEYALAINGWLAANDPEHDPYAAVNERHLSPPKAALAQVEAHGLLDAALDAKPGVLTDDEVRAIRRAVYDLAVREAGSLTDVTLPTVIFVPTSADDPSQGYAVHTEEQLVLPYLPDPWSAGVVFQGLPGTPPGQLITVAWGGAVWHEATPFRLVLAEGDAAPQWDEAARTLTVLLPRSAVSTVRVSSLFGGELTHVGLWGWLEEAVNEGELDPARLDEIATLARVGRHWMFTPFRELTLVHATQRPLVQPELYQLTADREHGGTSAYLRGFIDLHEASTSKLDVHATWTEPRDDPAVPAPDTVAGEAHVMEIPIELRGQPILVPHQEARDVFVLRLEGERELYVDALGCAQTARHLRDRLSAVPPPADAERIEKVRMLAEKIAGHDFGDTKHRRVRYRATATSRFREYVPPGLWDELTRTGGEVELDLPATTRPAPPRLRHVLPTFGWAAETDGPTSTSRRRGGGVRIAMERGWWSSGEGELLAVVLGQQLPDRTNDLYRYSTFWGQDPLYLSPPLPLPSAGAFPGAAVVETHVALGELPGRVVTVVGFEPQWDDARGRWTVDLDLPSTDHYFPFVRLALARYQPRALVDVRLSSVVVADFVQTVPDRVLTVTRDAGGSGIHRVQVSGTTHSARRTLGGVLAHGPSRMVAALERRAPSIADEALAWSHLPGSDFTILAPGALDGHIQHWEGDVAVPESAAGETLRLIVREDEMFDSPGPGRVVYVDTVGL